MTAAGRQHESTADADSDPQAVQEAVDDVQRQRAAAAAEAGRRAAAARLEALAAARMFPGDGHNRGGVRYTPRTGRYR